MLSWIVSLVIAATPCDGPTNRYDDRGQPTGRWIGWHPGDVLANDYCYVGGKLHGLATTWYPNGALLQQGHYHLGEQIGRWRHWDTYGNVNELECGPNGGTCITPKKNGRIITRGPDGSFTDNGWLDDVPHGRWTLRNSFARVEETFDHGKRVGTWSQHDAKGALVFRSEWRAGVQHGTDTTWIGGHKSHETTWVAGEKHGTFTQWYENGVVNATGQYVRGQMDGVWTGQHPNGVPRYRNRYVAGQLDGEWIQWDDAGRVTVRQDWRHGKQIR